jgi:antitoxin (DNA-binding transcriptional repressor) of toxin-antitoxin stability system
LDFDVRSVREEAELRFSFWLLLMAAKGKGWNRGIIMSMATFHISEAEAARDFAGLLARVRAGAEVVIENDICPVAVLHMPAPPRRSIEECIALLPADSKATIDEDFASDVAAAIAAHREPLNPPAWD